MDLSRAPRIDADPKRFAELETSLPGITPAVLTARLRQLQANGLTPDAEPYSYRLRWDEELSIERGHAEAAIVTVSGDSSAWAGVLYQSFSLEAMNVTGDRRAAERLVAASDNVLQEATSPAAEP